ncbi:MAG: hypothetical protein PHP52_14995, partial [Bacteroidales bacterium]|nr:hypothetical protein [Bacteroidales bacterium]
NRNLIENSIFQYLRHGVTICDGSWYNVVAYNYFREKHATVHIPLIGDVSVNWSDIAIHGEAENTWRYENGHYSSIDSLRTPTYNLIEGNDLEYLCVDATHRYNGEKNTFLRNRVTEQIHVQGYDGFPDALPATLLAINAAQVLSGAILATITIGPEALVHGGVAGYYIAYYFNNLVFNFCCEDCAALRFKDIYTSSVALFGVDPTYKFVNQKRQIFVNNFAREYNWWKCQILDYPMRMHSPVGQFKVNTYKRYVNCA